MQPHPTYLPTSKICRVELCTELFYAIIPTLEQAETSCYAWLLCKFRVFHEICASKIWSYTVQINYVRLRIYFLVL